MSGIDNILSRLDSECLKECEEIIETAKKNAEEKKHNAIIEAGGIINEKTLSAKKEAEIILSKAYSSAASIERRIILTAKVELIEDILNKTLVKLRSLDAPSYFTVLEKLALKNALKGKGVMYLSKKDLDRLPENFGASFTDIEISRVPYGISDGFILKYGDIEVNCTFAAMLSSNKEELKAVAGEMLFND